MQPIETELKNFRQQFDKRAEKYFAELAQSNGSNSLLHESKIYSFFSGGKRFRPFLSYITAQALQLKLDDIFPIALATELIHTYSLIHDDLPCMDNDDFRRGQPTNHKKFGEDIALLAGDALLTDAFAVLTDLATSQRVKPETVLRIIKEFSIATGSVGMVSGQTWDMKADKDITYDQLKQIHQLKTGRLIENAVTAVAVLAQISKDQIAHFKTYGQNLGLAFQIKDDLLDTKENSQDAKSFPFLIGVEKTQAELSRVTTSAEMALAYLSEYRCESLKFLLDYNLQRNS